MDNFLTSTLRLPGLTISLLVIAAPVGSQPPSPPSSPSALSPRASALDLDPKLIESSPVLQRWLQKIPDVAADIKQDPSFRSRLRFGYSQFPLTNQAGGLHIGIEDVFVGKTALTVSADYQTQVNGDKRETGSRHREAWGTDLHYYVRPLGSAINLAPVVGYRHLGTARYSTSGINLGARLMVVLSRGGGADVSLTHTWVSPGSSEEVGLTTLSFGYAVTHNFRLSTDIQQQNAKERKDSRVGIGVEWMP